MAMSIAKEFASVVQDVNPSSGSFLSLSLLLSSVILCYSRILLDQSTAVMSNNIQIRSLRAEIPYDVSSVDGDSVEDISSFDYSQGVTFHASIVRGSKKEEITEFDAFAVDMRTTALNPLLFNEMKLRGRHGLTGKSVDLPTGCASLIQGEDGSQRLVIDES